MQLLDAPLAIVDPETAIPPAIQALTGISNDMVAGAPTFAELARELHQRLAGRVVVARTLCAVELSA